MLQMALSWKDISSNEPATPLKLGTGNVFQILVLILPYLQISDFPCHLATLFFIFSKFSKFHSNILEPSPLKKR
jgi:hypothetical protein